MRVDDIDGLLERISRQPFRARFHLQMRERTTAGSRGLETMRRHAAEIIAERLAPAAPRSS